MTKIFGADEMPTCPECGKGLDEGPARDYVVWNRDGTVSLAVQDVDCGWCDAMLKVYPVWKKEVLIIVFSNKY